MQENYNYENEIKEEENVFGEEGITDDERLSDEDLDFLESFGDDDDSDVSQGDTLTPGQSEEVEDDEDYDLGDLDLDDEDSYDDEEQQNGGDQNTPQNNKVEKSYEKMIPQSKVNEIAAQSRKEGRESAMRELLQKYGLNSNIELDDLFGRGQSYADLDNDYNIQGASYREALAENALLKTGINQERWEDVKLILSGKGLEITPENIESHLVSHPEWKGNGGQNKTVTEDMMQEYAGKLGYKPNGNGGAATLKKLGNEARPNQETLSEEEMANKLYGF